MELRGPPDGVLSAFGRPDAAAHSLGGGEGRAWSAGDLVLKRVEDVVEATWTADLLHDLVEDGFRVNRPVRSESGAWVVDGWSAWTLLVGVHVPSGRWHDVVRTGKGLSAALREVARPAFLDVRTHPWAVGDRMAWGEQPLVVVHEVLRPLAERLSAHVRPDDDPSQVIHGDLTGNVLFAPGLAPGIIDFTPYWRPAGFCQAIVVVDAVLWHGASPRLLDTVSSGRAARTSLPARAALYRLIASDRLAEGQGTEVRGTYLRSAATDHERLLGFLDGAPRSRLNR